MAKNYTQLKQKESASSPGLFKESKPYSLVLYCINKYRTVASEWVYSSQKHGRKHFCMGL